MSDMPLSLFWSHHHLLLVILSLSISVFLSIHRSIYKPGELVGFHGVVRYFDALTGDLCVPPLSAFKNVRPAVTFRLRPLEGEHKAHYCPLTHTIWGQMRLPKEVCFFFLFEKPLAPPASVLSVLLTAALLFVCHPPSGRTPWGGTSPCR